MRRQFSRGLRSLAAATALALCPPALALEAVAVPPPPPQGPLQALVAILIPELGARERWLPLVAGEAQRAQVPVELADAIISVTSGYVPAGQGNMGEVGLMRIRPWAAMMHGFRGRPEDLADPVVNLRFGLAHLAAARRLARGDLCRTVLKYAWNFGEERLTADSLAVCARVHAHLARVGSPLAQAPLPTLETKPVVVAAPVRVIPVPEPRRAPKPEAAPAPRGAAVVAAKAPPQPARRAETAAKAAPSKLTGTQPFRTAAQTPAKPTAGQPAKTAGKAGAAPAAKDFWKKHEAKVAQIKRNLASR